MYRQCDVPGNGAAAFVLFTLATEDNPQALKRAIDFRGLYGTTAVVPFPKLAGESEFSCGKSSV
jgi:hypothetical protein